MTGYALHAYYYGTYTAQTSTTLLATTMTFATLVYHGSIPLATWAQVTILASIPTMLGFLSAFFSEWKLTKKYPKRQRVQLCEEDRELLRRALGRSAV